MKNFLTVPRNLNLNPPHPPQFDHSSSSHSNSRRLPPRPLVPAPKHPFGHPSKGATKLVFIQLTMVRCLEGVEEVDVERLESAAHLRREKNHNNVPSPTGFKEINLGVRFSTVMDE